MLSIKIVPPLLIIIMRKMLLYLLLILSIASCRSTESHVIKNIKEKELCISFYNATNFTIDIVEGNPDSLSSVLHLKPKKNNSITKKIYAADDISLFFYPRFNIPVSDTYIPVTDYKDIRIESKNGLNQTVNIVKLNKPNQNIPYYVVLKNNADKEISICNSSAKSYYLTINKTKTIIPKHEGIYSSKDRELFSAQQTVSMQLACGGKIFDFHISQLQPAFVYTYSFDGTSVVKKDERPLINVNEPLWSKPYTSTEIAGIFSDSDKELYYAIGKENKKNEHGELYEAAYINCMDSSGTEKWQKVFTENNCDTSFYSGIVLEDGSFLAAGSHTKEAHAGLIVQYSKNGTVLQSQKISSFSLFDSIIKIDGETTLLTGFDSDGNFLTAKLTIKNNSLNCIPQNSSIPLNENEAVSKAVPFYDEASKTLLLFCNLMDKETEQTLPSMVCTVSENGNFERISLQNTVKAISSVVRDSNGLFYIGGETVKKEQSAASVVCFDYANKKTSVFYTDGFPYSYISAMHINEKSHELVISGTLKASDAFGNSGKPFIKSFDIGTGKELWKTVYQNKQYELLSSFVTCARYGFIATFTNVSEDGEYTTPVGVLRLNAVGKGGIDN